MVHNALATSTPTRMTTDSSLEDRYVTLENRMQKMKREMHTWLLALNSAHAKANKAITNAQSATAKANQEIKNSESAIAKATEEMENIQSTMFNMATLLQNTNIR